MIEYALQATGKLAGKLAELIKLIEQKSKMKARVKSTGETINVVQCFNPAAQHANDVTFQEYNNGLAGYRVFKLHELEFISEPKKEIDWEQRRYELAKEVLPRLIDRIKPGPSAAAVKFSCSDAAKTAIDYADALIEELKK